jgi:hypothetical protein
MTEYLQPDISPVVNAIYEAIKDWFPRQKAEARGQLAFAIAHDVLHVRHVEAELWVVSLDRTL